MQAFVWDRHFDTGLETVDEQHHRLVDLINRLGESLVDGESGSGDALEKVFGELADYANYHFAEEERLMDKARLDPQHTERHRSSHRRFIDQVTSMWTSRNASSSPITVLHDFLVAWLSFHILGEDQAMARQLVRIEAGATPTQAFEAEEAPKDNATSALLRALGNLYHVLSEQNHDLADANVLLERRVAERTDALERANKLLEKASRTDGLLGISNRMHFDECLEREWHRAVRERTTLALLMLDVDHFKRYNDRYGHQAGDDCLRAVARAAQGALRRPADMLARYGGEELVLMLPNTDIAGARVVARAVHDAIAQLQLPHAASPVAAHVTVSIGVANVAPERGNVPAVLIAAADQALYAAKAAGRNRVHG